MEQSSSLERLLSILCLCHCLQLTWDSTDAVVSLLNLLTAGLIQTLCQRAVQNNKAHLQERLCIVYIPDSLGVLYESPFFTAKLFQMRFLLVTLIIIGYAKTAISICI